MCRGGAGSEGIYRSFRFFKGKTTSSEAREKPLGVSYRSSDLISQTVIFALENLKVQIDRIQITLPMPGEGRCD